MFKKISGLILLVIVALMVVGCAPTTEVAPEEVCWATRNVDPKTTPLPEQYSAYVRGTRLASIPDADKKFLKCGSFTVIRQGEIGFFGDEILPPGTYLNIPNEYVRVTQASVIPGNFVGAYCHWGSTPEENDFRLLEPGVHNLPQDYVRLWPVGTQVFRTLSAEGSPNLLDLYKSKPDDPMGPCGGRLICEASITRAVLKETSIEASIDVDVYFNFDLRDANVKRLCELRSPQEAVQAYVVGKTRSARGLSDRWTAEEFKTDLAQKGWQEDLMGVLTEATRGQPIIIQSVERRSVVIGSKEYQQQMAQQEAEKSRLLEEAENAQLRLQNQLEAQKLEEGAAEFKRQQALLDAEAEAQAYRTILEAFEGQPWQVIAVFRDYLEVNSSVNIDGSPTTQQP